MLRSVIFIKELDYKEYVKLMGELFNIVVNKEVVFLLVDILGLVMKERKEIILFNMNESLKVKKVILFLLGKILRGNVYVIFND